MAAVTLSPDGPPPAAASVKPKLTAEERRAREANRLTALRLRMAIWQALDDGSITFPAGIGAAIGMPGPDAAKMLSRKVWREEDIEQPEAAAIRLGLQVPMPDPWRR
jgi:hypothetical protein